MASMLERLRDAQNAHDAEQMAGLFAEDYQSSQPAHPGRRFAGSAQVRANWTAMFEGIPDFTADLIASSVDEPVEWGEWDWHGTHLDGSRFSVRGVMIVVVRGGLISKARLYMEPVEEVGEGIESAVRGLAQRPE